MILPQHQLGSLRSWSFPCGHAFLCVLFFAGMSCGYAEYLRAARGECGPRERQSAQLQHVHEAINLDAQLDLGERIKACLNCEIGPEKTAELLEHIANKKGAGSQPSSVD